MHYNFDEPVIRKNTNSFKWDKFDKSVLPMWIADMDFQSPPEVQTALQQLVNHGVFGYTHEPAELIEVVIDRLEKLHNWKVKKEWIVLLPGLVPGIHASTQLLGGEFNSVMTSTPVYYPFMQAADSGPRQLQAVQFLKKGNKWAMDFDEMKAKATLDTKMYLLCNPHNPNGRVFSRTELEELASFCLERDLLIMSDEIHCDLILDESKSHISIASISPEIADKTITLLAPSKTFNIAGLGCSMAVIPNLELRNAFRKATYGILPHPTAFAYEAALAAYKYGEEWRKELIAYLKQNHDFLLEEVNKIKGLEMLPLDATYLAWIKYEGNFEGGIEKYLASHGLGVSPGEQFAGDGFFRLNFGTQKANVEQAVEILKKAFA
ncbi:cystathione beta-lyase [Spirosomataceae bacterium TFI 002]|nr:cystathione beta-lyase [Spirosomataceae bacterium TFI 002]